MLLISLGLPIKYGQFSCINQNHLCSISRPLSVTNYKRLNLSYYVPLIAFDLNYSPLNRANISTMATIFTLDEVAKHNSAKDLWIVVHNKGMFIRVQTFSTFQRADKGPTVYDVSRYLNDHPGGGGILKEVAGTDSTGAFEDTGHSDEARELLNDFLLGDLADEVSMPA